MAAISSGALQLSRKSLESHLVTLEYVRMCRFGLWLRGKGFRGSRRAVCRVHRVRHRCLLLLYSQSYEGLEPRLKPLDVPGKNKLE